MQVAAGLQRARPEQPAEPAGRRRHVHHQEPVRPNEHYGQVSVQMLVYVVFVHFVCYEVRTGTVIVTKIATYFGF